MSNYNNFSKNFKKWKVWSNLNTLNVHLSCGFHFGVHLSCRRPPIIGTIELNNAEESKTSSVANRGWYPRRIRYIFELTRTFDSATPIQKKTQKHYHSIYQNVKKDSVKPFYLISVFGIVKVLQCTSCAIFRHDALSHVLLIRKLSI